MSERMVTLILPEAEIESIRNCLIVVGKMKKYLAKFTEPISGDNFAYFLHLADKIKSPPDDNIILAAYEQQLQQAEPKPKRRKRETSK